MTGRKRNPREVIAPDTEGTPEGAPPLSPTEETIIKLVEIVTGLPVAAGYLAALCDSDRLPTLQERVRQFSEAITHAATVTAQLMLYLERAESEARLLRELLDDPAVVAGARDRLEHSLDRKGN